jgi:hypothetical protein
MPNRKKVRVDKILKTHATFVDINDGVRVNGSAIGDASTVTLSDKGFEDRSVLRHWWHAILRSYGKYNCYGFMLLLPSDKSAFEYLSEFGRELNIISGRECLIIALSTTGIKQFEFDEKWWQIAIKEQVDKGYCLTVAQILNIELTDFPCFVLFQDIRSPEHLVISLKNMDAIEISIKLRQIFSLIQRATTEKQNPLTYLKSHQNQEKLKKAGNTIISQLRTVSDKTFEIAMEAIIKSTIAPQSK